MGEREDAGLDEQVRVQVEAVADVHLLHELRQLGVGAVGAAAAAEARLGEVVARRGVPDLEREPADDALEVPPHVERHVGDGEGVVAVVEAAEGGDAVGRLSEVPLVEVASA
jgi:hypothetical protein